MKVGITDIPESHITRELLGLTDHIDALVQFICQCSTPMTIAIQGDWGTGKTTIMNMIRSQLPKKIECIEFNTWQYSQFDMQDDVPVALLMELLSKIDVPDSKTGEFLKSVGKWGRTGAVLLASLLSKDTASATKEVLDASSLNMYAQIRDLKTQLKNAIKAQREKKKIDRFVIFIDDLDRMNPGKAVGLLEVIKNFMDLPGCVFVLAVDYGVVTRGAREKYGADMDEAKARSFFDKIIQLPFNLPVSQYNISGYLKDLLDIPDDDLGLYKKLAEYSIGANPRALKRLANVMHLLKLLAAKNYKESLGNPEFTRVLFAILCLQMGYEPVYSALMASGDVRGFITMPPDERDETYAGALELCAGGIHEANQGSGKFDELKNRFNQFMDAFQRALPKQAAPERDGQEDDAAHTYDLDLITAILAMSGLTASASSALEGASAVRSSFDKDLVKRLPELCDKLRIDYRDFWALLEARPEFRINDTKFELSITIASTVALIIQLNREGISVFLYSEYKTDIVKKPFYELLADLTPRIASSATVNNSSYNFIAWPDIAWKVPVDSDHVDGSEIRYNQVRDTIRDYVQPLLPALLPVWRENSASLDRLHGFIERTAAQLATLFPEQNGWSIEVGKKGLGLFHLYGLVVIRKTGWPAHMHIALWRDNQGQVGMSLRTRKDPERSKDGACRAMFQRWLDYAPMPETACKPWISIDIPVGSWLPKDCYWWTCGSYYHPDFRYALDAATEDRALAAVKDYARRFLAIEKEMDELAVREQAR